MLHRSDDSDLLRTTIVRAQVIDLFAPVEPINRLPEIEKVLPPIERGYPISRPLARLLSHLIVSVPFRSVLEFGAGASSLIIALSLKRGDGGRLTTVENNPEYSVDQWKTIGQLEGVDARLVVSTLRHTIVRGRSMNTYADAGPLIADRGPYDFVLIDGPEGKYGREGTLHQAYAHLDKGAIVILDDCQRTSECEALRQWLLDYQGLEPILIDPQFGGRGVAILQVSK